MKAELTPGLWAHLRLIGCTCTELDAIELSPGHWHLAHDQDCPLLRRLAAETN